MRILCVENYEQAVTASRAGEREIYALCPACKAEQLMFVDLPEETESPCVQCKECFTVVFRKTKRRNKMALRRSISFKGT